MLLQTEEKKQKQNMQIIIKIENKDNNFDDSDIENNDSDIEFDNLKYNVFAQTREKEAIATQLQTPGHIDRGEVDWEHPINDLSTPCIYTLTHPELFWNGKGDPSNKINRRINVEEKLAVQHLFGGRSLRRTPFIVRFKKKLNRRRRHRRHRQIKIFFTKCNIKKN